MKNFKLKKYDFTYLLNPIMIISTVSVFIYVLKLFGIMQADRLYFGAALIIIAVSAIKKENRKKAVYIFIIIAVLISILYYLFAEKASVFLAEKLKDNYTALGVLNGILNTAGISDLDNLIYYTSYGGTRLIQDTIVCGVINIAKANPDTELSFYLSGKIISMFSLLGIVLSIKENRGKLLVLALISVLCGNPAPLLLALLLVNMPLYFMYLLFNFLSFLIAQLFSVKSLFYINPSLFEIVFHSDNLIYIFVVSIFFAAISYYASGMLQEKRMNKKTG